MGFCVVVLEVVYFLTPSNMEINKNRLGLWTGGLLSGFHLVWLVLVFTGVAKMLFDWILSMHMLSFSYSILEFNYLNGLILLVMTFVVGYAGGFALGAILNCAKK